MKILSVVGARPQFVKLFPMHTAAVLAGIEHRIVHTGQHYDPNMSALIFQDLGIPEPDVNLEIGSGSHAEQTGAMLMALEPVILHEKPDWVLVYGDTNSTLAAALASVKIHVPVAHLEAGLRSGNTLMPEEHNRIATDHLSNVLLAPTPEAMQHLGNEGLGERSYLVGDVMVDACNLTLQRVLADPPQMPSAFDSKAEYAIATIHRAENTDSSKRIESILQWLSSQDLEIRLLAHPRFVNKCKEFGIDLDSFGVKLFKPLTYSQMIFALNNAKGVVTDSGGLQKEAFLMRLPTITVRKETEWSDTLTGGWNILDNDLTANFHAHFGKARQAANFDVFGTGDSASRALQILANTTSNTLAA